MTGWFALVLIVAVVIATAAIFAAGRKAGGAMWPQKGTIVHGARASRAKLTRHHVSLQYASKSLR